jgi:hypothetical protein
MPLSSKHLSNPVNRTSGSIPAQPGATTTSDFTKHRKADNSTPGIRSFFSAANRDNQGASSNTAAPSKPNDQRDANITRGVSTNSHASATICDEANRCKHGASSTSAPSKPNDQRDANITRGASTNSHAAASSINKDQSDLTPCLLHKRVGVVPCRCQLTVDILMRTHTIGAHSGSRAIAHAKGNREHGQCVHVRRVYVLKGMLVCTVYVNVRRINSEYEGQNYSVYHSGIVLRNT